MKTHNSIKALAFTVAGISLIAAVGVFGHPERVSAFASPNGVSQATGTCLFSQQLQKSVSARRQYMVQLDNALGRVQVASNSVEDMYGSIQKASYSPQESDGDGEVEVSFLGYRKYKGPRAEVDAFSADCLSCHDGVGAMGITVVLKNSPYERGQHVDSFTSDHPIGMVYNSYVNARKGGYKPIFATSKITLINGRVGCLSCHDPLNPEKGHLVMSDRESALCQSCHDK
ncbi:cytochrome c [Geomonas sp. Red276]